MTQNAASVAEPCRGTMSLSAKGRKNLFVNVCEGTKQNETLFACLSGLYNGATTAIHWLARFAASQAGRATASTTMSSEKKQLVASKSREPQLSAWTVNGRPKSVVASIEPTDRSRAVIKLGTKGNEFRRSPAPSPPSMEEKNKANKKTSAKSKVKS